MNDVSYWKIWPDLLCLYPAYGEDGTNGTRLYLAGNRVGFLNNKTETVLKQLVRAFATDLRSLRSHYGEVGRRRYYVPLAPHPELVLIPLRARHPLGRNDGGIGYAVLQKIDSYHDLTGEGGDSRTRIIFRDGSSLDFIHQRRGVELLLAQAQLAAWEAAKIHGSITLPREAPAGRPRFCSRYPKSGPRPGKGRPAGLVAEDD